jgi:phage gp46-like protein
MPDIKLTIDSFGNSDAAFLSGDIQTDAGLETAVYLSLFTDAYDPDSGDGGYWGDALGDQALGSLLWTLRRSKMTADLPSRVKACISDALAWLTSNAIASSVSVTVTKASMFVLSIEIDITKPDSSVLNLKYAYNWQAQAAS